MELPPVSDEFSLTYSGSLGAMQLDKLNPFLEHSEYVHVNSGSLESASFAIGIHAGHATGTMKAVYRDLYISIVNKRTGSSRGIINTIGSVIINQLKLRNENGVDTSVLRKNGRIDYVRKPRNTFVQVLWFSLRTGLLDILFLKS
jgi:hypothetical protein